jgi:thiamine kinase-like enzyme
MCCFVRLPSPGASKLQNFIVLHVDVPPKKCTTRMGWRCRQPARYASVCSHWNDLLAGNSEVWKNCVLTYTAQQHGDLVDIGTKLSWLMRRCTSIESVTFRNYKVGSQGETPLIIVRHACTCVMAG